MEGGPKESCCPGAPGLEEAVTARVGAGSAPSPAAGSGEGPGSWGVWLASRPTLNPALPALPARVCQPVCTPACLSPLSVCLSVGLPIYVTQLLCQPACSALRFAASCAAGAGRGESASAADASPKPSPGQGLHAQNAFLCREALRALPSWGQRAQYRQASQRGLALRPWRKDWAGVRCKAGRLRGPGHQGPRPPGHSPRDSTWKCRMMVQIRPRVSLGLPSAMSSFLMFTNFTCEQAALSHT